ncbi:MAG TPA: helix-turn-helix transcriptional regulator [Allosphingosinicella sp.]|jgi:transcriptional regulator with XRE-family HTH domain|nr:helix-turn-helix transcriptional regulator [Allosphingosinicella sp.]
MAGLPLILSPSKDERDRLARKLCDLLIEARIASGLNQGQIGKAVGRSQSFVSNYERGQRRLDLPDLILVCRVLKVDPVELLKKLS